MAKRGRRASTPEGLEVRNREVRRVRISDIVDNPKNFRTHDDSQKQSFSAAVDEIGWFGYPDVFEHPDHPGKFMLIDGELRSHHLAAHYGDDAAIDVNVTDFSPDEADKALATKDPLAAMAGVEKERLEELLRSAVTETESPEFAALLQRLADDESVALVDAEGIDVDDSEFGDFDPQSAAGELVPFKFGTYAGNVSRDVFDRFESLYRELKSDDENVLLSDVLAAMFERIDDQA